MAVHHPAEISPTKLELLQAWVPHQPWAQHADTSALVKLGSFRFDDPAGEVGVETHLLGTADGQVLQVPLTYRGAPREGAEDSFITTMSHTTLGQRWIYDAVPDPVYVSTLVTTVLTGGREADLFLLTEDGRLLPEPVASSARGSGTLDPADVPRLSTPVVRHEGTTTRIDAGVAVTLLRTPTTGSAALALTGTWPGQDTPLLLATVDRQPHPTGA
jgi:hypothetical protein